MNYSLTYAISFHPWEDLAEHQPFASKLGCIAGVVGCCNGGWDDELRAGQAADASMLRS